jgi:hypothetical protein
MRFEKFCGSMRDHEPHEWTTPHRVWVGEMLQRVTYLCSGPPTVEGGSCFHHHRKDEA